MPYKINIQHTLDALVAQEDTDGDKKITVEDEGPKRFVLSSEDEEVQIIGTYHLSNLLQELVIAKNSGLEFLELDLAKIEEPPVQRISRMIREYYWNGLTRSMDSEGISRLLADTKNETLAAETKLNVYVPFKDTLAFEYYTSLEEALPITTVRLPEEITPAYVRSRNKHPGILSLKLMEVAGTIKGIPFVVPGGRFNEMYGWDSYFEAVGLLLDQKTDLARGMADHFQYQIAHYGKILNANRSYYLTRTQPPFYSSMVREVFEVTQDTKWLRSHLETVIQEYETVWMVEGKRLTSIGLNRYLAEGIGVPPETEAGHFAPIFSELASQLQMDTNELESKYTNGELHNDQLDHYFVYDRSVRESGHDTSYRLEGKCAQLVLVELNAMLYKYEMDIAELILAQFGDRFSFKNRTFNSDYWFQKANQRKELVDQYLWNNSLGMYFDFDLEDKQQLDFISATTFAPLWSKMASKEQAVSLVKNALPLLKEKGGLAACTRESRGEISSQRPQRQWDYPNGWAPHQMMLWRGLKNYGFENELREFVYRWLYMITKNAVDYNGTIPEKYDVVEATHKVFAEYGNVGTDFKYITQEGFGWMNASYQYGISLLDADLLQNLNDLKAPESIFEN